jgi:hypothetical protein
MKTTRFTIIAASAVALLILLLIASELAHPIDHTRWSRRNGRFLVT